MYCAGEREGYDVMKLWIGFLDKAALGGAARAHVYTCLNAWDHAPAQCVSTGVQALYWTA